MNKKPIKHTSAGGFVFFIDSKTKEVEVLLIQDKNKKFLIPKGHTEIDEDLVLTAIREIKEETGLLLKKEDCLGLCTEDNYSWKEGDTVHTKQLFIYTFLSKTKELDTISEIEIDIESVGWFSYEFALSNLCYNSSDLVIAKKNIDMHT